MVFWNNVNKEFQTLTLNQWLDGAEHNLSSLLLLGEGARGKSKLCHMIAKELTIGKKLKQYVFGKSIDPLGTLSDAC